MVASVMTYTAVVQCGGTLFMRTHTFESGAGYVTLHHILKGRDSHGIPSGGRCASCRVELASLKGA